MEVWEDAGMTREEYEMAMEEMAEAFPSEPLSDNDLMAMHIDHVLGTVIPEGQRSGFDVDMWDEVCHALEEGDILQYEEPTKANMELVGRLAAFAHENGYDPKAYGAGSVHDWANSYGESLALFSDSAWPPVYDDAPQSVHDVAFDEMVDYCVAHGQPWSAELRDELNAKVIRERDAIEQDAYAVAMEAEALEVQAGVLDDIRARDGLNGDEPDIPAYEAERLFHGRPSGELLNIAEEMSENAVRQYEAEIGEFYGRVFAYGNRDFSVLPDTVRAGMYTADFAIQRSTYDELGESYAEAYRSMLQKYASEKSRETHGVDFSKPAIQQGGVEGRSTEVVRQVDAKAKSSVSYDYTPRFADSPDEGLSGEFGDD